MFSKRRVEARSIGTLTSGPRHCLRRPPSTTMVDGRLFLSLILSLGVLPEAAEISFRSALHLPHAEQAKEPDQPEDTEGEAMVLFLRRRGCARCRRWCGSRFR